MRSETYKDLHKHAHAQVNDCRECMFKGILGPLDMVDMSCGGENSNKRQGPLVRSEACNYTYTNTSMPKSLSVVLE